MIPVTRAEPDGRCRNGANLCPVNKISPTRAESFAHSDIQAFSHAL